MQTIKLMPKPNLRAVNVEVEHPLDRARREVKRFRLDREKQKLPTSNQVCTDGVPRLDTDEVLKRSEPDHLGKKI